MGDDAKVPRKYWWVVPAVPVAVALIAILPQMVCRGGSEGPVSAGTTVTGNTGTTVAGNTGVTVTGNNNTLTFDYSTRNTFVTNINIIAKEYEVQTGRPLSDDLRKQIDAALAAAQQNNPAEAVRLFDQVAKEAPVPAVLHNLGVGYEKTGNAAASARAFQLSKEKIAELTSATTKTGTLPDTALKAPVSGPAIQTESSALPTMTIGAVSAPYEPPGEIDVVVHGTSLRGAYRVKYRPKPGVPTVMEPGAYDVVLKNANSNAGFLLASNVEVKEGTLTRLNPDALVGGVAVEAVTKKGFPVIKNLQFVDKDSLIAQATDKLGLVLPIAPGSYQVVGTTADGQQVKLADSIEINAGAIVRFDPLGQVAAIVVYTPKVSGLDMKAVYVLKAGTDQAVAKVEAWDVPMLVRAGVAYDIALEQAGGLARIRTVTPARGELVEIR